MKRRSLIAAGAGAAAAAASFPAPAIAQGRIQWRMVTSWPRGFPGLGVQSSKDEIRGPPPRADRRFGSGSRGISVSRNTGLRSEPLPFGNPPGKACTGRRITFRSRAMMKISRRSADSIGTTRASTSRQTTRVTGPPDPSMANTPASSPISRPRFASTIPSQFQSLK